MSNWAGKVVSYEEIQVLAFPHRTENYVGMDKIQEEDELMQ